MADIIIVTLLDVQVDLFDYILAFLVLLTRFVGSSISPTDHALASSTKDIAYTVQPSYQHPVFRGSNCHIDTLVKQISSPYEILRQV